MGLEIVEAYEHGGEIKALFDEYTDMVVRGDSDFKAYMEIQNYDEETRHLENKYGLPFGRLYLAYFNGEPAGCIGLRKLDEQSCEMKRLYVREKFRGQHIGDRLVELILSDARKIGYSYMLLDTFPFLERAIQIYEKLGFREIPRFNDSPMKNAVYMKLDL